MAIGATGVPAVAVEYMNEVEFATILKMTNTKVLSRANDIQSDFNISLTELGKKIVRYNKPNAIPDDILETAQCTLRPNNTINNNVSNDEVNNNIAIADNMVDTYYKGQNTQIPEIVEYEKEEMRKRIIIHISPSLPWGYMDEILSEVKTAAKVQYESDKIRGDNQSE